MQHKERSTDYSENTRLGIRIDKDLQKKLVAVDDEIDRLEEQHRRRVKQLENEKKFFELRFGHELEGRVSPAGSLPPARRAVRANLDGRKKSIDFAHGRAGFRKSQETIEIIDQFEAAYREADGYIVLCTITQPPTTEKERGRLYVQGTYNTNSISNLLSDVNKFNGKVHIYTNIHPLREPPQRGRGKESDILGVTLFATDIDAKDFISDPAEKKKAIEQKAFYEWSDELLKECKAKVLEHIQWSL